MGGADGIKRWARWCPRGLRAAGVEDGRLAGHGAHAGDWTDRRASKPGARARRAASATPKRPRDLKIIPI